MLDLALRPVKEGVLLPFIGAIPASLSPNTITYIGFGLGVLSSLFSSRNHTRYALCAWLINRLLDGLDGTIARKRGKQSSWGGYIDIVCDFTVYSLIPIGLATSSQSPPSDHVLLPLAFLLGSVHVNNVILFYLASAIPQTTRELTSLQMVPALVEGTESFVLFTAMIAFPTWFVEIAWVFTGLVCVNIIQRSFFAKRAFEKESKKA